MGTLHYGTGFSVEMDDHSLIHLDAILQRLRGTSFQLHIVGLGGSHDGSMVSLTIGAGAPLWVEFYNGPDITISMETINYGVFKIQVNGALTLPLAPADSTI